MKSLPATREGRAVQLRDRIRVRSGKLPHDLLNQVHLNNPVVSLVGDQHVRVRQEGALDRRAQEIGAGAGFSESSVLPDDFFEGIHKDNAVVYCALWRLRNDSRRSARAGHQGQNSHALRVIATNYRIRREIVRAAAELPENVAISVAFNNAIIELVSDEDISGMIETRAKALGLSHAASQENANNG